MVESARISAASSLEVGLTISEENIIPKKFGIFGMDLNSVRIPGFRRLKFPRSSFGIPVRRTLKKSEFRVPKQGIGFGIPFCTEMLRKSRNFVLRSVQSQRFRNYISCRDAKKKLKFHEPN